MRAALGRLPIPTAEPTGMVDENRPVSVAFPDGHPPTVLNPLVPAATGRPSIYTPMLAKRICDAIQTGLTLQQVGKLDWSPNLDTLYSWMAHNREFSDVIGRARVVSAHAMVDKTVAIADEVPPERDAIRKAELRIGARQWLAGKLNRQYADKQILEHVDGQSPDTTNEMLAGLLRGLTDALAQRQPIDVDSVAVPQAIEDKGKSDK